MIDTNSLQNLKNPYASILRIKNHFQSKADTFSDMWVSLIEGANVQGERIQEEFQIIGESGWDYKIRMYVENEIQKLKCYAFTPDDLSAAVAIIDIPDLPEYSPEEALITVLNHDKVPDLSAITWEGVLDDIKSSVTGSSMYTSVSSLFLGQNKVSLEKIRSTITATGDLDDCARNLLQAVNSYPKEQLASADWCKIVYAVVNNTQKAANTDTLALDTSLPCATQSLLSACTGLIEFGLDVIAAVLSVCFAAFAVVIQSVVAIIKKIFTATQELADVDIIIDPDSPNYAMYGTVGYIQGQLAVRGSYPEVPSAAQCGPYMIERWGYDDVGMINAYLQPVFHFGRGLSYCLPFMERDFEFEQAHGLVATSFRAIKVSSNFRYPALDWTPDAGSVNPYLTEAEYELIKADPSLACSTLMSNVTLGMLFSFLQDNMDRVILIDTSSTASDEFPIVYSDVHSWLIKYPGLLAGSAWLIDPDAVDDDAWIGYNTSLNRPQMLDELVKLFRHMGANYADVSKATASTVSSWYEVVTNEETINGYTFNLGRVHVNPLYYYFPYVVGFNDTALLHVETELGAQNPIIQWADAPVLDSFAFRLPQYSPSDVTKFLVTVGATAAAVAIGVAAFSIYRSKTKATRLYKRVKKVNEAKAAYNANPNEQTYAAYYREKKKYNFKARLLGWDQLDSNGFFTSSADSATAGDTSDLYTQIRLLVTGQPQ